MSIDNYNFIAYILTPPSINGEISRWVLDYYDINFKEKRRTLAPGSLIPALRYKNRAKGSKFEYIVDNSKNLVFRDPEKLAQYFNPLFEEDIRLLEPVPSKIAEPFDTAMNILNENIRNWSYSTFSPRRKLFLHIMTSGVPVTQKIFMTTVYPLIKLLLSRSISPSKSAQIQTSLHETFDNLDSIFSDNREFLNGERLTYNDMALSVNIAPTVMPPEYGGGGIFPLPNDLPQEVWQIISNFRQRPTGQYVLKLYQKCRLKKIIAGK